MRILLPVNSFTDCIKKIFPLDHIQAIWCYLKQKSMKYAKKISWQMDKLKRREICFWEEVNVSSRGVCKHKHEYVVRVHAHVSERENIITIDQRVSTVSNCHSELGKLQLNNRRCHHWRFQISFMLRYSKDVIHS